MLKFGPEHVSQMRGILRELNIFLETNNIESLGNSASDCLKRDRHQAADSNLLLGSLHDLTKSTNNANMASSLRREDIVTLGRYSFDSVSPTTRRLALRCLQNILVLAVPTRQIFVDENFIEKTIELLNSINADDEFLAARILLLCSSSTDFLPYLERGDLAETIIANISRYSNVINISSPEPVALACNANLSLLSVLAARYEAQAYRFFRSLDQILEIFDRVPVPSPPLDPPMSSLISCLATLPFYKGAVSENTWSLLNDSKLIDVLDLALRAYNSDDLETCISPLVWFLFSIAPSVPTTVKCRLQARLLPSDQDRMVALGTGDSLPHRLVRISTEAVIPQLKRSLAGLFLELSDSNPEKLVRNLGFGCASGLLYSLGMPVDRVGKRSSDQLDINFITGQRRDKEDQSSLPDLTQEEKQREAERLFVLFERLRSTGVVNIENPVNEALRLGRFQEVEDGIDEDLGSD